jgi:hypothetical protein
MHAHPHGGFHSFTSRYRKNWIHFAFFCCFITRSPYIILHTEAQQLVSLGRSVPLHPGATGDTVDVQIWSHQMWWISPVGIFRH